MAVLPPADVPFIDRDKVTSSARKRGSIGGVSFVERRIDIKKASAEQVAAAITDPLTIRCATNAAQDRDTNFYESIYCIGPEDGFPLKVGIAGSAEMRISALQTGNWQKLRLHGLLFSDAGDALAIEQLVHKKAKKANIAERGEWIWASLVSAVDLIMEAANDLDHKLMTPAMAFYNQGMAMRARDKAIQNVRFDPPLTFRAKSA